MFRVGKKFFFDIWDHFTALERKISHELSLSSQWDRKLNNVILFDGKFKSNVKQRIHMARLEQIISQSILLSEQVPLSLISGLGLRAQEHLNYPNYLLKQTTHTGIPHWSQCSKWMKGEGELCSKGQEK